jgi:hypothetical protein
MQEGATEAKPEQHQQQQEQVVAQPEEEPEEESEEEGIETDPEALAALQSVVAAAELSDFCQRGPVRLQPRGLVNTGNSCFLNCTLQVGEARENLVGVW